MKKLNISQVSAFFANGSYPIEFLLYFPYRINTTKLRRALKKVSTQFWPAFGTYSDGCITQKKYLKSECFDESTIDDIFDSSIAQESLYFKFGKQIPDSIPRLFYLKALHFTNGTVLIAKMNHLVGDGYSYFYLLTVLAAITKRGGIPLLPLLITTIFKPKIYSKLHSNFHLSDKPVDFNANYNDLIVEVMDVDQIETKKQAKSASEKSGLKVSTNDILCAQLVKFILKSKSQQSADNFGLVIPIDMRRAVPELGQRYFGNGIILYRVSFNKDEIEQKNIENLAIKIRENFPSRSLQGYNEFIEEVESKINTGNLEMLRLYDPETEFLVTNLTRMPLSRLDFGLGPPEMVIPLTRGKSGAGILAIDDKYILQLGR